MPEEGNEKKGVFMKKILAALDAALAKIPLNEKKTIIGALLSAGLFFLPPHIAAFIPFESLVELLANALLGVGVAHKGIKLAVRLGESRDAE